MTASGCAAAGRELDQFFDVSELGAIVTKSIMRDPRSGRPTPRMAETPSGMLNSIGLQGPGIDSFLAKDLPWLVARGARPIVSIAGAPPRSSSSWPGASRPALAWPRWRSTSAAQRREPGPVFACDPVSATRVVAAVREVVPRVCRCWRS
jgi:dihydroorotate dehydrogenase (NAD+) catalytic subunit